MIIVKQQTIPLYELECNYCKSVFRINKTDIKTKETTGIFGLPINETYIKCPVCNMEYKINGLKSIEKFLTKEANTEEKQTPQPTTPEDPKPEKNFVKTTIKTVIDERFKKSFNDCMDALHKFGEAVKCACDKVIDETPTEQTTKTPGEKEANEKEIYHNLIKKYGKQQIIVAIEELSELQKELCKHLRDKTNQKAIIEEVCDVQIMLDQIILYFGISALDLDTVKRWKLERTKERMLAEEKEV